MPSTETNTQEPGLTGTGDAGYVRPYGDNAPWNIPVADLVVDPDSAELADLLWNDATSSRPGNFNFNNTSYTYPVYEVTPDTPYYPVNSTTGWGNLDGEEIPFDPSWEPAPGSDGQIIILDPATGREWNLWQASFDGNEVQVSNGSLVGADGDDWADYYTYEGGWAPSRGVGIQYLAMLVRPEEVAEGEIRHALSMPIRNTSGEEYVAPATKLEHPSNPPGIPEGTRFALDVTDAEIDAHLASLPSELDDVTISSLRTLIVAMRDYGWFITDTSGAAHLQLESTTSAYDEWDELGLIDANVDGKAYPRDALDGLISEDNIYAIVPSDEYELDGDTPPADDPVVAPDDPADDPVDDGGDGGDGGDAPDGGETSTAWRVEAEDFDADAGMTTFALGAASGEVVRQADGAGEQRAVHDFGGESGRYDVEIGYFDEEDGTSSLALVVDGVEIERWTWNQSLGSDWAEAATAATRTITDVAIDAGDEVALVGTRDGGEPLRVDYVDFTARETGTSEPDEPVDDPADDPADDDGDGGTPDDGAAEAFRVEVEAFDRDAGMATFDLGAASGDVVLQAASGGEQRATYGFDGASGSYDVEIGYFDEEDGVSSLAVVVDGVEIDRWTWDAALGSDWAEASTAATRTIADVALEAGDEIALVGERDGGEPLRLDYVDFTPVDAPASDPATPPDDTDDTAEPGDAPTAMRVEAEAFDGDGGTTIFQIGSASGDAVLEAATTGERRAVYDFDGASGRYDVEIGYYDEEDGASNLALLVDGVEIERWTWDETLGSDWAEASTATTRTLLDIAIETGDEIALVGERDGGEPLRLDYVEFSPVDADADVTSSNDDAPLADGDLLVA